MFGFRFVRNKPSFKKNNGGKAKSISDGKRITKKKFKKGNVKKSNKTGNKSSSSKNIGKEGKLETRKFKGKYMYDIIMSKHTVIHIDSK